MFVYIRIIIITNKVTNKCWWKRWDKLIVYPDSAETSWLCLPGQRWDQLIVYSDSAEST